MSFTSTLSSIWSSISEDIGLSIAYLKTDYKVVFALFAVYNALFQTFFASKSKYSSMTLIILFFLGLIDVFLLLQMYNEVKPLAAKRIRCLAKAFKTSETVVWFNMKLTHASKKLTRKLSKELSMRKWRIFKLKLSRTFGYFDFFLFFLSLYMVALGSLYLPIIYHSLCKSCLLSKWLSAFSSQCQWYWSWWTDILRLHCQGCLSAGTTAGDLPSGWLCDFKSVGRLAEMIMLLLFEPAMNFVYFFIVTSIGIKYLSFDLEAEKGSKVAIGNDTADLDTTIIGEKRKFLKVIEEAVAVAASASSKASIENANKEKKRVAFSLLKELTNSSIRYKLHHQLETGHEPGCEKGYEPGQNQEKHQSRDSETSPSQLCQSPSQSTCTGSDDMDEKVKALAEIFLSKVIRDVADRISSKKSSLESFKDPLKEISGSVLDEIGVGGDGNIKPVITTAGLATGIATGIAAGIATSGASNLVLCHAQEEHEKEGGGGAKNDDDREFVVLELDGEGREEYRRQSVCSVKVEKTKARKDINDWRQNLFWMRIQS